MGITTPAIIAASIRNNRKNIFVTRSDTRRASSDSSVSYELDWPEENSLLAHINQPLLQSIYSQIKLFQPNELKNAQLAFEHARETLNRNRKLLHTCANRKKIEILSAIKAATQEVLIQQDNLKKLHQKLTFETEIKLNNAYFNLVCSLTKYQKEVSAIFNKKETLKNNAIFLIFLITPLIFLCLGVGIITLTPIPFVLVLTLTILLLGTAKPLHTAYTLREQHPANEAELNNHFNTFTQILTRCGKNTPDNCPVKNTLPDAAKPECSNTSRFNCMLFKSASPQKKDITEKDSNNLKLQPLL